MRFLLYSHDGFGLGHTRRHLAVASALTEMAPQASVLLASGADDVYRFELPPHVEVLKLPTLRKVSNGQYLSRRLSIPTDEVRSLRSSLLEAAVHSFRPSVMLVDKHPFGVNGEFAAALNAARETGARGVLGLRDILDERAAVASEWAEDNLPARIADYYELVLVYGERAIFDPITEYQLPSTLAERTRFCGYAVNGAHHDPRVQIEWLAPTLRDRARPLVLATAGGGEDGFFLFEHFVEAATDASWQGIVVAGPMMAEAEFERLQQLTANGNVILQAFVPDLQTLFRSVDAVVCMGGYNTLAEALSVGVPTVCVPRVSPRREQLMRAEAFERLGLLRALHPEQLNRDTLRQCVQAALSTSREELLRRANAVMSFDGARQAAVNLLNLASVTNGAPEGAAMRPA